MSVTEVCRFYNPYFKNGCQRGDQCRFLHYTSQQYVIHCLRINERCPLDKPSINIYNKYIEYWTKKHYKQCLDILQDLLNKYPFYALFHEEIAKCYDKLNISCKAFEHHQRLIAIQPNNAKYHLNYALHLNRHQICSLKPIKQHFLRSLSLIEMKKGDKYNKLKAKIHGHIADFLYETKIDNIEDIMDIIHHYELSLKFVDSPGIHYNYARLLHDTNHLEKAEIHYKKSIQKSCSHSKTKKHNKWEIWSHFYYALLLKKLKRYKQSEEKFIICLKMCNKHNITDIVFEYGLLLCQFMNKYELGLKYLDSAQRFAKDDKKKDYLRIYKHCQQIHAQQEGIVFNVDAIQRNKKRKRSNKKQREGRIVRNSLVLVDLNQECTQKESEEGKEGSINSLSPQNRTTISHSYEVWSISILIRHKYDIIRLNMW